MFKEIKEELTGSKEQIIDYGTFTLAIIAIIITSLKASEGVIPAVDVGYVAAAVIPGPVAGAEGTMGDDTGQKEGEKDEHVPAPRIPDPQSFKRKSADVEEKRERPPRGAAHGGAGGGSASGSKPHMHLTPYRTTVTLKPAPRFEDEEPLSCETWSSTLTPAGSWDIR